MGWVGSWVGEVHQFGGRRVGTRKLGRVGGFWDGDGFGDRDGFGAEGGSGWDMGLGMKIG